MPNIGPVFIGRGGWSSVVHLYWFWLTGELVTIIWRFRKRKEERVKDQEKRSIKGEMRGKKGWRKKGQVEEEKTTTRTVSVSPLNNAATPKHNVCDKLFNANASAL